MADKNEGFLEVGMMPETKEVMINHPDLKVDELGCGHIVFSLDQARNLAYLLIKKANECEREAEELQLKKNAEIPVDRSKRCMTNGKPETPDHREIDPVTGQQKGYIVLCAEERAKGFVRPVRDTYKHLTCGTTTIMGRALAETYARDPGFYSGTFCCTCRKHFPLDQFVWAGTNEKVGS